MIERQIKNSIREVKILMNANQKMFAQEVAKGDAYGRGLYGGWAEAKKDEIKTLEWLLDEIKSERKFAELDRKLAELDAVFKKEKAFAEFDRKWAELTREQPKYEAPKQKQAV